jgi:hypothetical protein
MKHLLTRLTATTPTGAVVSSATSLPVGTTTMMTQLLTSYFSKGTFPEGCFISLPTFTYSSTSVTINLFYYLGPSSLASISLESVQALSTSLSRLCGKPVHLVLTRLHYPYLNAYILAQYLAHNATSKTFLNFQEAILTYPSLNANVLPGHITGIKVHLSGRLLTEALVPRITTNTAVVGSFPQAALVDYASYTTKNEIGTFTIKVWVGQSVLANLTPSL